MMAVIVYRTLDGTLKWLTVRNLLVAACKTALRESGTPAVAVVRRKWTNWNYDREGE